MNVQLGRVSVTGAAGFIGSHLVGALAGCADDVVAIDAFTPYYDVAAKVANAAENPGVPVHDTDLDGAHLAALLDGVDVVFHLAGQPGVRGSFGDGFDEYVRCNIIATQRLLEACVAAGVRRVVYSSSSSIYGAAERYPTTEDARPRPVSPYGTTKLAAEHLVRLYDGNFGLETVSLRYFTVYGPRQRPDMAMHRLVEAALDGTPFVLNGDGSQVRDFTYVDDAVAANLLAAVASTPRAAVYNIGGGSAVSLADVIAQIEQLTGRSIRLDRRDRALGDPARTGADVSLAAAELGWRPAVCVDEGLAAQVDWHLRRRARA